MHVQKITADMINDFNECISMVSLLNRFTFPNFEIQKKMPLFFQRDYRYFYNEHKPSIKRSDEDFKYLNFSNSPRCNFITQNFWQLFKFLRDYPFSDPKKVIGYAVETGDHEFVADMKMAIDSRNWDSFYRKYWRIADFIISQARDQRVLNITIEWEKSYYPSFEAIHNAIAQCPRNHPSQNKNSGEMLVIRPGPSKDSFYREARNKFSPSSKNYESGIYLRTESHSNVESSYSSTSGSLILDATALPKSGYPNSQNMLLPGARNGNIRSSITSQSSAISTISHGSTGRNSDVVSTPRHLHNNYGSSSFQRPVAYQSNSCHHSTEYRESPTPSVAPVANSENSGNSLFGCCQNSSRTTSGFENNTWDTGAGRSATEGIALSVISNQPVANINDCIKNDRPPVPPHSTNGAPYNRSEENPREGYSTQSQSHTHFYSPVDNRFNNGYLNSHHRESSPRPNDQTVKNNYNIVQGCDHDSVQSAQWQESFATLLHAAPATPEPSRKQKHIQSYQNSNVTPSETARDMYDQQFHSLPSRDSHGREYTHPQIASQNLEPLVADTETRHDRHSGVYNLHTDPNQTSSSDTTHPSYQELPKSNEKSLLEVRDDTFETGISRELIITSKAETRVSSDPRWEAFGGQYLQPQSVVPSQTSSSGNTQTDNEVLPQSKSLNQQPTEVIDSTLTNERQEAPETTSNSGAELMTTSSEAYGGHFLQPQSVIHNQILSSENAQIIYQVPQPSESLEETFPESIENSLMKEKWGIFDSTTLPQGFSMVNDSADMETLKKHDGSFEDLGSDTVRPDDEDQNKKSSEDSEIVDDHRSSMSSINIDFSPVEDSVISTQSCFDLDDLRRRNDTPVESNDGKFDDELFKHQAEMNQVNREVGRTENLIAKELEKMQTQQTIRPNNPDSMEDEDDNSDFNRQLEEIKRKHAEELRRIREERRRKQQKLDEELQKMRKESKERFRMFMTCIILKQRFEQQEDNWKDWIKDCRNNIVTLQKYFLIFEETYRRVFTGSKKKQPDSDDLEDFESEKSNFSRYVMNTYNALETDFETLKNIEQHYNDAMFLRVLQKCIADVAQMILEISDTTFSLNPDSFSKLDEQMSKLHVDLIYSTSKLRSVCSQAEDWKNRDVQFPRIESNYNFKEEN
ncbi:hypothetical protein CAEBREN_25021 [Caenorhabditis brenneri]|uniref:Uncharacterized protein n=1 Tax=Caenorhabditis brenneri TaxID=135651 RepID=G0MA72_CAEBE|nr:hypothetical protein CAEBREN_25021 [Caenorhabditis brenneri]